MMLTVLHEGHPGIAEIGLSSIHRGQIGTKRLNTGLKEITHDKRIVAKNLKLIREHRLLYARYDVPRQLVSSKGTSFTSIEFRRFCEINGVKYIRTMQHHPKNSGLAERFVRT
ncbi:hypothetical protein J437_LFUL008754 [Ladona fulva]|uniref:Integrase catalytic domain-containing protein n=1 Tax=Ladona fulva TaxID=123851 RepID=A0A8K0K428_LADFU|nr:hypothetical protein J437_LFUL008754 [Ladona fulva]